MGVMNLSLVYILAHLGRRILDFFKHWYWDGFLKSIHWFLNLMERSDKIFALRITAKIWLQPLYQDYSFIGYIWGFIFRTIRIIIGLVFYLILSLISSLVFLAWAAIPIFVIYQIFIKL